MINIKPLKAFTDNYIWLLETNEGVSVVDPGDAGPVINYLDQNNKNLADIFITLGIIAFILKGFFIRNT